MMNLEINQKQKTMSKLFSLNWKDFLKGLILGVGTPVLYYAQELIPMLTELQPIWRVALSAFIAYIIKNFFSDEKGNVFSIGGGGIKNPPKP